MTSPIIAVEHGVTVVVAEHRSGGWHRAIVIHSTNPSYPVGGHDITISDNDIARGRTIALQDDVMASLIAAAPVNGPVMTPKEFGQSIAARQAGA